MNPESPALFELLRSVRGIRETDISADGARLAWVETEDDPSAEVAGKTSIRVRLSEAAAPSRVTAGDGASFCSERAIRWSPSGEWLAFLSNQGDPGQFQLYLSGAAGGAARRLTEFFGQLAAPRWSPDGRRIAFLGIEGQSYPAGIGHPAPVVHGEAEARLFEQRLFLVECANGRIRPVSPPDLHVYEYDWAPDGRSIAYTAAPGMGENNYWLARLHATDLDRDLARVIHAPERQIASPRWSPDGKTLAFIGGIMSDQGMTGGDIWTVLATGENARNLTPGYDGSPSCLWWRDGPLRIVFTEWRDGGVGIGSLDWPDRKCRLLWSADGTIGTGANDLTLSLAADGRSSAVIRCSWSDPCELWAGPAGQWRPVTYLNAGRRPRWGSPEKLRWSCDGRTLQGWLLYPAGFDRTRRYPLVVAVHGGPAMQSTPYWPDFAADPALLSGQGYFVLIPNPRGSYGQGEEFTAANVKDFGYGDLRDILAGVDRTLAVAPIHPGRIGITGHSYGGFMALWAVTQTDRFRAAVASGVIGNWQSYFGQNGIDGWPVPYFGATVYDDPGIYARSSPIEFVRKVRAPTLILAGERDRACPAPQAYEFWHALKTLGVKTKLVIYAGEGHLLGRRPNIEDYARRMRRWFDENLT